MLERQRSLCAKRSRLLLKPKAAKVSRPQSWGRQPAPLSPRAALCLSLGSRGRTPKRAGIGAIRVKLQHPVIELAGGCCRVIQPNEVADVLARFFHIFRTVIVAGNLMSRNNRWRFQRVDFVKRGNPFQPGLPVRLVEKWMNAVIDGIAGDDQSDGWNVKTRRIISVGMPDSYND